MARRSTNSARSARVAPWSQSSATDTLMWQRSPIAVTTRAAIRESPPRSKKLSSDSTLGTPRASHQICSTTAASGTSVWVDAVTNGTCTAGAMGACTGLSRTERGGLIHNRSRSKG
ncbi:Uncharacterised protein [Mycobacteroides abscessus subsp. abscessus]|nr:Uncharacterised protein [Mycobacteroides abscessus subsp. abscessus]